MWREFHHLALLGQCYDTVSGQVRYNRPELSTLERCESVEIPLCRRKCLLRLLELSVVSIGKRYPETNHVEIRIERQGAY